MNFVRYQLPALLWAIIIFVSSSMPGTSPLLAPFFKHDKIVHTFVFFLCAVLMFRALKHQVHFPFVARHALFLSVLFTILYGAGDEFHQLFVPRRSADIMDFLADSTGAALSSILVFTASMVRKLKS